MDIWEKYKAWGERNRIANEKTEQQVYGELAPIMQQFREGFGTGGLAGITKGSGFTWTNYMKKLLGTDIAAEELKVQGRIKELGKAVELAQMSFSNVGRKIENLFNKIKDEYYPRGVTENFDIWDMKGKSLEELKEMLKNSDLSDWEIKYFKNDLDNYFNLWSQHDELFGRRIDLLNEIESLQKFKK